MDLDVDEMFGVRDSASRRGSVNNGSDRGSVSEVEQESDDGGRNNPVEEAVEVPDPGAGPAADAAKIVKPKRVIKNPLPRLNPARIAGPRGIPAVLKTFKNVKFRGKGHEKEDLDVLLRHLEHWAFRMYPRYPFKSIVEQMESLGVKKEVQVLMKRYRLDMVEEFPMDDNIIDDDVRRGIDEDDPPEPVVDVFDELLGNAFSSSNQPTAIPTLSTPIATQPKPAGLTAEQKERLERNKRLAAERRLAKLREQQNHEETNISNQGPDDMNSSAVTDDIGSSSSMKPTEDSVERMEVEEGDLPMLHTEESSTLPPESSTKAIDDDSKSDSSQVDPPSANRIDDGSHSDTTETKLSSTVGDCGKDKDNSSCVVDGDMKGKGNSGVERMEVEEEEGDLPILHTEESSTLPPESSRKEIDDDSESDSSQVDPPSANKIDDGSPSDTTETKLSSTVGDCGKDKDNSSCGVDGDMKGKGNSGVERAFTKPNDNGLVEEESPLPNVNSQVSGEEKAPESYVEESPLPNVNSPVSGEEKATESYVEDDPRCDGSPPGLVINEVCDDAKSSLATENVSSGNDSVKDKEKESLLNEDDVLGMLEDEF